MQARDENGVGLSDIEIRNEADTFLFEGKTGYGMKVYYTSRTDLSIQ